MVLRDWPPIGLNMSKPLSIMILPLQKVVFKPYFALRVLVGFLGVQPVLPLPAPRTKRGSALPATRSFRFSAPGPLGATARTKRASGDIWLVSAVRWNDFKSHFWLLKIEGSAGIRRFLSFFLFGGEVPP